MKIKGIYVSAILFVITIIVTISILVTGYRVISSDKLILDQTAASSNIIGVVKDYELESHHQKMLTTVHKENNFTFYVSISSTNDLESFTLPDLHSYATVNVGSSIQEEFMIFLETKGILLKNIVISSNINYLDDFSSNLLEFFFSLFILGFIILFMRRMIASDFSYFKKKWLEMLVIALIGAISIISFDFLMGYLKDLLELSNETTNNLTIIVSFLKKGGIFAILSSVIISPILEELIFRKGFFAIIRNKWLALILSSALFGILHVLSEPSIAQFFINWTIYSVSGVVFGLVYIKSRKNVFPTIAAHILVNLFATIMILIQYL